MNTSSPANPVSAPSARARVRWRGLFAGVLGLCLPVLAQAANLVVNSNADPVGFNPNITIATLGPVVTLRDAINAANNTGGTNVITFDPSLNGGEITLNRIATITISSSLTINGPGRDNLGIVAYYTTNPAVESVFAINAGNNVTISGLDLKYSYGPVGSILIPGSTATRFIVSAGSLTIRDCRFLARSGRNIIDGVAGNISSLGNQYLNSDGFSLIHFAQTTSLDPVGTLLCQNDHFEGNSGRFGICIYAEGVKAVIIGCRFIGTTAEGIVFTGGGGVMGNSAPVVLASLCDLISLNNTFYANEFGRLPDLCAVDCLSAFSANDTFCSAYFTPTSQVGVQGTPITFVHSTLMAGVLEGAGAWNIQDPGTIGPSPIAQTLRVKNSFLGVPTLGYGNPALIISENSPVVQATNWAAYLMTYGANSNGQDYATTFGLPGIGSFGGPGLTVPLCKDSPLKGAGSSLGLVTVDNGTTLTVDHVEYVAPYLPLRIGSEIVVVTDVPHSTNPVIPSAYDGYRSGTAQITVQRAQYGTTQTNLAGQPITLAFDATGALRNPNQIDIGARASVPHTMTVDTVADDPGIQTLYVGNGPVFRGRIYVPLRSALTVAEADGGGTVTFDPSLAGQTVTLTKGWSRSNDVSALQVTTPVTIQGPGNAPGVTLAIGAGVPRRHFQVSSTGALTLQNLTLTGGNCPSGGGAIFSQGLLNVDGCTFTGNTSAQEGGALWNYGAGTQTQVKNSTFAGNTSVQNGGAISTACELMTLTNVTIVDNSITGTVGGGIHRYSGATRLVNSIVARNTANGSPNNVTSIVNPLDAANSFNNLLGADVAGPNGSGLTNGVNGNKVGIAAASLGLGALASNGGLTQTVALLPGSPAVNGGTATGAPTNDQRGKLRPQFGVVDIGAFEQTPFDTGQTIVNVGGGYWYLGPDAVGSDLRVYRELPGQLATWVDNGTATRIGQALDGTVLVENSSGGVYARPGSTTGLGSGYQLLSSVTAGDSATWFLGPDGNANDFNIYRWSSSSSPAYSNGFATQLSITANGSILARNNAATNYLRLGSNSGLGTNWQLLNGPLPIWRALQSLADNGTEDLANPSRDGVANLLKYSFNLAPNAGDLARVNLGVLPANGTAGLPFITQDPQGRLFIEFVRRKAATNPGITCIIETGDDLTALQPLDLSGAAVVSIDATWERVTVTDPTITPNRFARVRVSVAP